MGGPNPLINLHGRETFNQTDAENFTITSTPNQWPFMPGRTVDGIGGKILSGQFAQGSLEWTKISTSISLGDHIPIGIFNTWGTPEELYVMGETIFVAMNRAFDCWVVEGATGHVAYYEKQTGILINGTFYTMMGGLERY
nr:hypothetical protein [Candidatus Sigynarchaeota archaeon]